MSERSVDEPAVAKARKAHNRLDDHEEALGQHDRRISRNENWRLQAQGALKVLAIILGAGGLAVFVDLVAFGL